VNRARTGTPTGHPDFNRRATGRTDVHVCR
jgi:hypothetical protein